LASSIRAPHEKRKDKQTYSKYYNDHLALSNGFYHWRYLQNKSLSLVQSFMLEDVGGEGKRNGFIKIRFRDKWLVTVSTVTS
jgi:hypothetical protein